MNVLIVGGIPRGGGAREHVLAKIASDSPMVKQVLCFTDNAGIRSLPKVRCPSEALDSMEKLAEFAKANNVELTIVGPEKPLADGIVDIFREHNLRIFGPPKDAALLETDKAVAKQMMLEAGVPTAQARVFESPVAAENYALTCPLPTVLKCAYLAAGKGVRVCHTNEKAVEAVRDFKKLEAGKKLLFEEFLEGDRGVPRAELSVHALVDIDGNFKLLPTAQDYKLSHDGDTGNNTGGVASISPVPWITADDLEVISRTIFKPIIDFMKRRGTPFIGVLYAGLMRTIVDRQGRLQGRRVQCSFRRPRTPGHGKAFRLRPHPGLEANR
jgi:phosphoribosylamine--glycine ligase